MGKSDPKRKRAPRPQKPAPKPLAPHQRATPGIGANTKRLIGQVVVEWANVEAALDDMIWCILGLGLDDGKALTKRMDAIFKIGILNDIAPRHLEAAQLEALQEALDRADILREDRNLIVHSVWGTLRPDNVPLAMALRPKAGPGEVMSESFSHERLRAIAGEAKGIRDALVSVLKQMVPWP